MCGRTFLLTENAYLPKVTDLVNETGVLITLISRGLYLFLLVEPNFGVLASDALTQGV